MPTYDYQCQKCGFEFERQQRITEDPIKTCPKCKSRQAKRLLSAPGFILKGGGWYADGYGSTGKKTGGSSDSSASSDSTASSSSGDSASSSSGSSGSSDTKSEKKSDKKGGKSGKSAA
jgi:putative FmdB family regulatory protein